MEKETVKGEFKGVDYFINKVIPKKLLVWVVATIAMFQGYVPGEMWAYISMMYLGVNVAGKFAKGPQEAINRYAGGSEK